MTDGRPVSDAHFQNLRVNKISALGSRTPVITGASFAPGTITGTGGDVNVTSVSLHSTAYPGGPTIVDLVVLATDAASTTTNTFSVSLDALEFIPSGGTAIVHGGLPGTITSDGAQLTLDLSYDGPAGFQTYVGTARYVLG